MPLFQTQMAQEVLNKDYSCNMKDTNPVLKDIFRLKTGAAAGFTAKYKITPFAAKYILENCPSKNRKPLDGNVKMFAQKIKEGSFVYNKESIKIARIKNGGNPLLLDGQHRLLGCVSSDTAIDTDVVFYDSMTEEEIERIMETLDTGKSRNVKDVFTMHGIANSNHKIAVIRHLIGLYALKHPLIGPASYNHNFKNITPRQCLDFYQANTDEIEKAVSVGNSFKLGGLSGSSEVSALYFHYRFTLDSNRIDFFVHDFVTGANLPLTSIAHKTRKYIAGYRGRASINKISSKERDIALNMAFEAYWNRAKTISFTPLKMDDFLEKKGLPRIFLTSSTQKEKQFESQ